jgi:hypothetical protein
MKFIKSKKALVLLAVSVVAVVAAVAGYAYWTSTGTGGVSGTAGTSAALDVTATVPDGLVLDSSVTVSGSAVNNTDSTINITTLSAPTITTDKAGCLPAWFNYVDDGSFATAVGAGEELAPNGGSQSFGGTLSLPNIAGTDQNACKGAKYTLSFTVS